MRPVLPSILFFLLALEAQCGVLNFAGTTSSGTTQANNLNWSLSLTFTENLVGASAVINAATLQMGNETFLINPAGNADKITVSPVSGPTNDTAIFDIDFLPSTPSGFGNIASGVTIAVLTNLKLQGTVDVPPIASDANIAALAQVGNLVSNGSFILSPGFGSPPTNLNTITLAGSVPAPEPHCLTLIACIGAILGRRLVRGRKAC